MIKAKDLTSKRELRLARILVNEDREFWQQLELKQGPLKTPCWCHTGQKFENGYGRVYKQAKGRRITKAHRYSFTLAFGYPDDLVLHKCDIKLCCNPNHLYDGTHTDNMQDTIKRKTMPSGIDHARAVLDERQVANIRMLDAAVPKLHVVLMCKLYKISKQTFFRIRNRKKYPHVQAAPFNSELVGKYKQALKKYARALKTTEGVRRAASDTIWIWRHDLDRRMCFYHLNVLGSTQVETCKFFNCSRNSVRVCVAKVAAEQLPVLTRDEYYAALDEYRKYRPV